MLRWSPVTGSYPAAHLELTLSALEGVTEGLGISLRSPTGAAVSGWSAGYRDIFAFVHPQSRLPAMQATSPSHAHHSFTYSFRNSCIPQALAERWEGVCPSTTLQMAITASCKAAETGTRRAVPGLGSLARGLDVKAGTSNTLEQQARRLCPR